MEILSTYKIIKWYERSHILYIKEELSDISCISYIKGEFSDMRYLLELTDISPVMHNEKASMDWIIFSSSFLQGYWMQKILKAQKIQW